jgi:myo-inositol-1(or 4)-monophosphatase
MTADSDLVNGIVRATHEAGAALAKHASRAGRTPARTMREFRTIFGAADGAALEIIRPALTRLRPDAAWGDEIDTVLADGEQWIVDAIDGAVQYLQDLPQWSVSATLLRDGQPAVAVLHNPGLAETYVGVAGRGATRNGAPVAPSAKTDLSVTLFATSQPPFAGRDPEAVRRSGASLSAVLPLAGAVRNLGPTSWQVADVASGRLDGFWEFGVDDGNLLGPTLIAREAGAIVTDRHGHPWAAGADSVIVAPPQLHPALLAAVAEH